MFGRSSRLLLRGGWGFGITAASIVGYLFAKPAIQIMTLAVFVRFVTGSQPSLFSYPKSERLEGEWLSRYLIGGKVMSRLQFVNWFPSWVGFGVWRPGPTSGMSYVYRWGFLFAFWEIRKWVSDKERNDMMMGRDSAR